MALLRDMEVTSIDEYKLCLKTQIAKDIKDEEKLKNTLDIVYSIFLDGIKFGRTGRVEIAIEKY